MSDLARRAVACPRWRWMPGMLTHETHPPSPLRLSEGYVHDFRDSVSERRFGPFNDYGEDTYEDALLRPLPDLTDPATIGCLLALVREAWGLPKACLIWNADKGRVHDPEMEWAQGDDNDPDVIALLNRYSWMVKGLGQTDEWLENIEGRVSPEIYQQVIRDILGHGASEPEALVNALEGAP